MMMSHGDSFGLKLGVSGRTPLLLRCITPALSVIYRISSPPGTAGTQSGRARGRPLDDIVRTRTVWAGSNRPQMPTVQRKHKTRTNQPEQTGENMTESNESERTPATVLIPPCWMHRAAPYAALDAGYASVHLFDSVDSTTTRARELLMNGTDADRESLGGRTSSSNPSTKATAEAGWSPWTAPPGACLATSIVVRPHASTEPGTRELPETATTGSPRGRAGDKCGHLAALRRRGPPQMAQRTLSPTGRGRGVLAHRT